MSAGQEESEPLRAEAAAPPLRRLSVGAVGRGWGEWQYRLLAPLARGGMGEIYIAERTSGDRREQVVVKRLLENLREDSAYVQMFRSEAEHLSRLDHPNIVKILDVPNIAGARCLALEYVHGRSVAQMLDQCQHLGCKIAPDIAVFIVGHLLAGLDHVHQARMEDGRALDLVHRDVTPGNVLVSFDGLVKLTDFGIAKSLMSAVATTVGIVKGKARYLSPEQILGEKATPRSDLFSAALVLYEMLVGEPLFERASVPKTLAAIVHGELPDLAAVLPVRAPKLVEVLARALSVQPEKRPHRAGEMALDLLIASHELGPPVDSAKVTQYLRNLFGDEAARPPVLDEPAPSGEEVTRSPQPAYVAPVDPAASESPTTIEAPSAPDHRPELKLRAASIAESEAVPAKVPLPAELPTPDLSAVDTVDGPKNPPLVPINAQTAHEQTLLVERARARQLPKFPTVPPGPRAASAEDSGVEGEEATLAVGPGDSAPQDSGSAFEAATESGLVLPPRAAEPQLAPSPDDRAVARAATQVERRVRPDEPTHTRPPPRPTSDTHLTGRRGSRGLMAGVFAAGTLSGVLLTALLSPEPPPPLPPEAEAPSIAAGEPEPPVLAPAAAATVSADPEPDPSQLGLVPIPPSATVDILSPRGARVRVDGELIKRRVPIRGLELEPGVHEIVIQGRKKRRVELDLSPGEHVDLDRLDRRRR